MKSIFPLILLISVLCQGQRGDFSKIDFGKADSIALAHKGEGLRNLPILIHRLTASLETDVEKFRAIYTWVATNIENDYHAYLRTIKKRKKHADDRAAFLEWNESFTPKVFEKLVEQRKTACSGYAFLVREMAKIAGLNCKIIDGYGRTPTLILDEESIPNHAWNAIELDGKWYLVDATWSAGRVMFDEGEPRFEHDYFDGYFLADPALFIKNHYPLENKWTLLPNPPTFNQFLQGPIVYKEAFASNIVPVQPDEMFLETTKSRPIEFILETPKDINNENIILTLNNGNSDRSVHPVSTYEKRQLRLKHVFDKTGKYDVHIQLNDTIVATYVVKVKRK
ncbi:transglutaminase domain-containing protein [Maribacter algicola]|uniref:Transglutaminase domain-containing protein n=1 Tax=Meishania litoralis TaxID=3434685 RepID=A0ACC7LH27_9FLAO